MVQLPMQLHVIGRRRLQEEEGLWDGKMPFAGQEEKVAEMERGGRERTPDTWIAQSLGTK